MQKISIFLLLLTFIFSCQSENGSDSKKSQSKDSESAEMPAVLDYFYPKDTTVYMYVYQNTKNPDDQYVERVVYKEMDGADHFFVSRYTMKMEPVSTMSYWVIDRNIELVKANMMVGRVSYESKITSGQIFPESKDLVAKLSYDYPINDSLINVIEMNRKFDRTDTLIEADIKTPVMIFNDSLRLSIVDIKNKQHQQTPAFMQTYFGKGLGKVLERNDSRTYRLIVRTTADDFAKIR